MPINLNMIILSLSWFLTVYVVKAAIADLDCSLQDLFIGTLPFVAAMLAVTLLLVFFPTISLLWF